MPPVLISSTPCNFHEIEQFQQEFTIVVGRGPSQRTFHMGKQTLAFYSGSFRSLHNLVHLVQLPNESSAAFGMALYYILNRRFFPCVGEPGTLIDYDQITEVWDFGRRFQMPLIMNAAINLFANKIRVCKVLPNRRDVEYLWIMTPPGSTLRRLLVDLVREMWVPDGNRHAIWVDLVGGMSLNSDNLVWAIEELNASHHTVRVSQKTIVRLLSCEWHSHEARDDCEGAEEYQLQPEHFLRL